MRNINEVYILSVREHMSLEKQNSLSEKAMNRQNMITFNLKSPTGGFAYGMPLNE